ncbi:MAG TPA: hypothetical protein VJ983_03665, partial [candidate division Zixibacteria bacterium]|nr:hypothetical protein [candidate division Zixibacteria bacterium]
MLVSLAAVVGREERPAVGLDTLAWFESDIIDPPISVEGGKISLATIDDISARIRLDVLEEVPHEPA